MRDVEAAIGEALVRGDATFAPWRGVARRIAAVLERGDFALDDLVWLASADPGIAVRVLSAAARGGGEAPASLPLAVERIGEAALLAIARDAAAAAGNRGPLDGLRRAAWRGAVGSALLCRALARARGLDGEEAWLCGLLHDVGGIAALSAVERLSAGARSSGGPSPHWERCLERWHVPLGLSLAAEHGFPRPVVDAIALHHAERADPSRSRELVRIVRTADSVVRALWDEAPDPLDSTAIEDLTEEEAERLAPAIVALPSVLAALEARGAAGARPPRAVHGVRRAAPPEDPQAVAPRESRGEGCSEFPGPSRASETQAAQGATTEHTLRAPLCAAPGRGREGGATQRCAADRSTRRWEGSSGQPSGGVRLRIAGAEYAMTGVAQFQVVVQGPAPLGEGAVLEVEPFERPGPAFHARVLLSWADGERFGAVLAPFALGWPAIVAWEGRAPLSARA